MKLNSNEKQKGNYNQLDKYDMKSFILLCLFNLSNVMSFDYTMVSGIELKTIIVLTDYCWKVGKEG